MAQKDALQIFEDQTYLHILSLTYDIPRSAEYLINNLKISPPVIYRKLNTLLKMKFIRVAGTRISNNGRRVKLYSSCVKSMSLKLERTSVKIIVIDRESPVPREKVIPPPSAEHERQKHPEHDSGIATDAG